MEESKFKKVECKFEAKTFAKLTNVCHKHSGEDSNIKGNVPRQPQEVLKERTNHIRPTGVGSVPLRGVS